MQLCLFWFVLQIIFSFRMSQATARQHERLHGLQQFKQLNLQAGSKEATLEVQGLPAAASLLCSFPSCPKQFTFLKRFKLHFCSAKGHTTDLLDLPVR